MTKRGVEGPWVSVDQPPLPTSMPGAGQCPGSKSLEEGSRQRQRLGQGVVQLEDHLPRHVTAAPPNQRLDSQSGQGVVHLEDHLPCHVTGAPPHNQVLDLSGKLLWTENAKPSYENDRGLLERPGRGWPSL